MKDLKIKNTEKTEIITNSSTKPSNVRNNTKSKIILNLLI